MVVTDVLITHDVLDIGAITAAVSAPDTGAVTVFVGTTRDTFEGKHVAKLEYEVKS